MANQSTIVHSKRVNLGCGERERELRASCIFIYYDILVSSISQSLSALKLTALVWQYRAL